MSSHILFTNAALPPWLQRATDFLGDKGVARGALMPYAARAKRIEFDARRLPVHTGPWRGLGAGPNCFAIETAMDAAARVARKDPVAFRLEHLGAGEARLARVLRRAAQMADWPARPAAARDTLSGRGIACGTYKEMSYSATVAEVAVSRATGEVRVTRLWSAHDCGLAIDPDRVRAQVEGNLLWGLGMVLKEKLELRDGAIAAAHFGDYRLPTLADTPEMRVDLIEDAGAPPAGAGETAIVSAAGAIGNAITDATGVRLSRLPVAPAALAGAMRAMGKAA